MRVETAFSGLVDLLGVWVRDVSFEPGRVRVEVALRRRRLVCPECEYSTRARKDTRPGDTVWRHLDLGVWRLEICCRRRRLWCPVHGARAEGVPFARPGSEFTCDFECLVAWLAARTEKTTITRMLGIDWGTVGQIIRRVCADGLDPDRLSELFDIGVDEVSWKRQHNYLTLVGDHRREKIVWGCEGGGRCSDHQGHVHSGLAAHEWHRHDYREREMRRRDRSAPKREVHLHLQGYRQHKPKRCNGPAARALIAAICRRGAGRAPVCGLLRSGGCSRGSFPGGRGRGARRR